LEAVPKNEAVLWYTEICEAVSLYRNKRRKLLNKSAQPRFAGGGTPAGDD
jgi:hypothetical protein